MMRFLETWFRNRADRREGYAHGFSGADHELGRSSAYLCGWVAGREALLVPRDTIFG